MRLTAGVGFDSGEPNAEPTMSTRSVVKIEANNPTSTAAGAIQIGGGGRSGRGAAGGRSAEWIDIGVELRAYRRSRPAPR